MLTLLHKTLGSLYRERHPLDKCWCSHVRLGLQWAAKVATHLLIKCRVQKLDHYYVASNTQMLPK